MAITIWFTGLSGSGKTTLAGQLQEYLTSQGKISQIIDGDTVRQAFHAHLGFSAADIHENNRLILELILQRQAAAEFILVPVIAPFASDRAAARAALGKNFVEVYVQCSAAACAQRDTKGLYAKAAAGELTNLIGAGGVSYEAPERAEITVNTEQATIEQGVQSIIRFLQAHNYLDHASH